MYQPAIFLAIAWILIYLPHSIGGVVRARTFGAYDNRNPRAQQAQLTGQFLLDREGVVRWTNIECARDGLAGLERFPTDDELIAAARAL